MADESVPARRAVAAPVLIVEDNRARSNEILAEVEFLGLAARAVPGSSMYAVPGPGDVYSLAIVGVRSLQPNDLSNAAAIRRAASTLLPILLICEGKEHGAAPWPNCTVVSSAGIAKKLRLHIGDILGISLNDRPGSTLKE